MEWRSYIWLREKITCTWAIIDHSIFWGKFIYIYFFCRNFATHLLDNIIIPASNSSLLIFKQQQSVIIFCLGEPHPKIKNNTKNPPTRQLRINTQFYFFDFDFPFRRTDSGFRSSSGQPWCDLSIYQTITQQRLKARSIIWKLKLQKNSRQLLRPITQRGKSCSK